MPPPNTPISREELIDRFGYHPANSTSAPLHSHCRDKVIALAADLVDLVPAGREASLMVTHLEEALMWANKAIARLSPVDVDSPEVARVLPHD